MMGKREKKKRQRRKGVNGGVRGEKMEQRKRKKENRAEHFHNSVGDGNQYQGNSEFLIQKFYRTCFK